MKLQRQTKPVNPLTVKLNLKGDEALSLKTYANYYEATYGELIEQNHLIKEILSYFLSHDREFAKWQRHQEKPDAKANKKVSPTTHSKDVSHEDTVSV